jgi:hypothetical protein
MASNYPRLLPKERVKFSGAAFLWFKNNAELSETIMEINGLRRIRRTMANNQRLAAFEGWVPKRLPFSGVRNNAELCKTIMEINGLGMTRRIVVNNQRLAALKLLLPIPLPVIPLPRFLCDFCGLCAGINWTGLPRAEKG